ncbi:AfsR/SARP family transcriptional regulator [Nonomuraea typhae]|uniref:AfsR/SARP family transcriptional regulator n=1 Tax=Nonomuraea typhae TaxID=2603600 RepID=UPI001CA56408|nr:BTAD domain-containing putative transcriptional regulator [Nonomuraea typhae]
MPELAPRHRAVLAYLLLHARHVVSTEQLIEAMWGPTPPGTARSQIHGAVTGIRRALRAAGLPDALRTKAAGYVLVPEPGQLDLEEFTTQVAHAHERAATEPDAAAAQLRAALALWVGQPLTGVNADYAPDARSRLEERRLAAFERLADLELSLGRHDDLIAELIAVQATHPLRERLTCQLMLALHRAGRQADALAVARTFRATLIESQGLDPSRLFVMLEQSILRDEPGLAASFPPVAGVSAPVPPVAGVSSLPYDIPDFAGRAAELDLLACPGVPIIAIDGMGGIGKTALAIHAAHRLACRYPDGQLFIDLHAHTAGHPPVEPEAALESLLRQLRVPADRIAAATGDRAALWRSELAGRRVLVVLDNAAGVAQILPLLPGTADSMVIITSRHRLAYPDGARTLSLDTLAEADAVELFTAIVGERAINDPAAVLRVLRLCGFLPLAVRIAATRLHRRPLWDVDYLARRLAAQSGRLDELTAADRGVKAAFTLSYQHLDPDQQRLFRLLGLHPGGDIDVNAAAALAALPVSRTETLLEGLLDAHVLIQQRFGRYAFHDLLREHARCTADAEETADRQREALIRLFDHYLGSLSLPAAELETERANLVAVAAYAAEHDLPAYVTGLAQGLHRYLDEHAHYADAFMLHRLALKVSRRRGDRAGESRALVDLGVVYLRQGSYVQAREHYLHALRLYRELGDPRGEGRALNHLGDVCLRLRDHAEAHKCFWQVLELCRAIGERVGEAAALGNLGLVHELQGAYPLAHEYLRLALDLYRELGLGVEEARILSSIGTVYRRQGLLSDAHANLYRSVRLCRRLGYRSDEATGLNGLGEVARAMGRPSRAVADHEAALALAGEIGVLPEQARAHRGLAGAYLDLHRVDLVRDHAKRALDLYTHLGTPEAAEVRAMLAHLDDA